MARGGGPEVTLAFSPDDRTGCGELSYRGDKWEAFGEDRNHI